MAQEISRPNIDLSHSQSQNFLFVLVQWETMVMTLSGNLCRVLIDPFIFLQLLHLLSLRLWWPILFPRLLDRPRLRRLLWIFSLSLFNVLWTPAYPKRLWLPISILSQTNVRHLANHPLVMNSSHSKSLIDQLVCQLTYIFREIPCLRLPLSLSRSIDLVSWQTPGKWGLMPFKQWKSDLSQQFATFPTQLYQLCCTIHFLHVIPSHIKFWISCPAAVCCFSWRPKLQHLLS